MNPEERRRAMVAEQIVSRGVRDPRVLEAMASVPREAFVEPAFGPRAYDDVPLPIGANQTISQPYVVAYMIEALRLGPGERVLEIGTGSGYAAAVASRIASLVHTVERHRVLADEARERLSALGYANVEVHCADGTLGWPAAAPYDAILVSAGGPAIPAALRAQVVVGGRIVAPIGRSPRRQRLVRETCAGAGRFDREDLGEVRFVPLIGVAGWSARRRGRPWRTRWA